MNFKEYITEQENTLFAKVKNKITNRTLPSGHWYGVTEYMKELEGKIIKVITHKEKNTYIIIEPREYSGYYMHKSWLEFNVDVEQKELNI